MGAEATVSSAKFSSKQVLASVAGAVELAAGDTLVLHAGVRRVAISTHAAEEGIFMDKSEACRTRSTAYPSIANDRRCG